MRPAPDLHVEWVDDEAVVLNPQTGQIHYLNQSAAFFYALVLEYGLERARVELTKRTEVESQDGVTDLIQEMELRGLLLDD